MDGNIFICLLIKLPMAKTVSFGCLSIGEAHLDTQIFIELNDSW